jgi:hypothetical protein
MVVLVEYTEVHQQPIKEITVQIQYFLLLFLLVAEVVGVMNRKIPAWTAVLVVVVEVA